MNKLTKGSNMRWESMRMILPEWKEQYEQQLINEEKIERPFLSDDQKEEINIALTTAIAEHQMIDINYFKDGFIKKKIATPYRIDFVEKKLIVLDEYGMKWTLRLNDICSIG